MPCLKDLKVRKVSFVRSAANKRSFILMKSADAPSDVDKGAITSTIDSGGSQPMSEQNTDQKPDLSAEIAALNARLEALQTENTTLRSDIAKAADDRRRGEIRTLLAKSASFAPINPEEFVERIMKLEKTDPDSAKFMLDSIVKTSESLRQSPLFDEAGASACPSSENDVEHEYVREIAKVQDVAQKSGNNVRPSAVVENVIRSMGARKFEQYRDEHIRRAARH